MSPEAQRIAIGEACPKAVRKTVTVITGHGFDEEEISIDPLKDLNAMHEAEKVLTNAQRRQYVQFVIQAHPLQYDPFIGFEEDPESNDGYMKIYFLVNATAAQRA